MSPILSDRVSHTAELVVEEAFGSVITIRPAPNDDAETMEISDSKAFGLSSDVRADRLDRITGLNVGTVNIWEAPDDRIEMSPFGGIKDSGFGYKEGVIEAMKSGTDVWTHSTPWLERAISVA